MTFWDTRTCVVCVSVFEFEEEERVFRNPKESVLEFVCVCVSVCVCVYVCVFVDDV